MRAVILAAGVGRRLVPMGWDRPKCLLPCPQGTLLDNMISASMSVGVREFVIVIGHRRELVEQASARHAGDFEFVINERFSMTNTLYSLWLARDRLGDGFLLVNGDVWFRSSVVERLMDRQGSCVAVEPKVCGEEEVKVVVDPGGRVLEIGKHLAASRCLGEYVGIGKFDASSAGAFVASLENFESQPDLERSYYEAALAPLLDSHEINTVRLDAGEALEIDTPEDYEGARRLWAG